MYKKHNMSDTEDYDFIVICFVLDDHAFQFNTTERIFYYDQEKRLLYPYGTKSDRRLSV